MRMLTLWLLAILPSLCTAQGCDGPVRVGSKGFTESVILGEVLTQSARAAGAEVLHRRELGGTRVLWNALLAGEIDAYPEYTGTLRQELLAGQSLPDLPALAAALARQGLRMGPPLGFDNTYAIGVTVATARRYGLETISDLGAHPELTLGFSSEFLDRADGWRALRQRYGLPHRDVRGLNHDLAYRALVAGELQVIDLYATDAEIPYYDLRVLRDDLGHFPAYQGVVLYRARLADCAPQAVKSWKRLGGAIDATAMAGMNAKVKLERQPDMQVAAAFLQEALGISAAPLPGQGALARFRRHTLDHLRLVAISLGAAIVVAVPLGILAHRRPRLGQALLAATSVVQTIPSLALFVFLIPLLGIGATPAITALLLYSLLPIVRNTYTGLSDIPLALRESAEALGLPAGARLRRIELPLAARAILAGVKTAAVINVGTATLGALIGAGGYGQPILTGIRLDDTGLILSGAVPAAVLALLVQGLFELAERWVVPRGLRVRRGVERWQG